MSSKETENKSEVERTYVSSGNIMKGMNESSNPGYIHYADIDASYDIDSLNLLSASVRRAILVSIILTAVRSCLGNCASRPIRMARWAIRSIMCIVIRALGIAMAARCNVRSSVKTD